jgi:protein TonB
MEKLSSLEEIIFANRNKIYGAYNLRQTYNTRIKKAVTLGILLISFAMLAPTIFANFAPNKSFRVVKLSNACTFPEPPKDEPIVPELPPPPPVPQVKTTIFLPPEITIDANVPNDEPLPTQDDLKNTIISDKTQDGIESDVPEIIIDEPTATIATPITIETIDPMETFSIEQQPEYPGGYKKMMEFLSRNLKYPRGAATSGVSGKVFLNFVISKDGDIQKIQVSKGIGFGCDEEAMRVLGQMPRWTPGKQSGRTVPVRFTLPINFQLE